MCELQAPQYFRNALSGGQRNRFGFAYSYSRWQLDGNLFALSQVPAAKVTAKKKRGEIGGRENYPRTLRQGAELERDTGHASDPVGKYCASGYEAP